MVLLQLYNKLKTIAATFSKNPRRVYSEENLLEKRELVYSLAFSFQLRFDTRSRDSDDLSIRTNFLRLTEHVLTLIYGQLFVHIRTKMSNLDLKTASSLKALEDSKDTKIRDFIDEVEAYHDLLNPAGQGQLIPYVVKAKIKGSCKTRLGDATITTLAELKSALHSRVKPEDTYDKLYKKLKNAEQNKFPLPTYAAYLESTVTQLAALYIRTEAVVAENEKKVINDVFKMISLCQFKLGVVDRYKPVLDASRPRSLADALAMASASSSNDNSAQLFNMKQTGKKFDKRSKEGGQKKNKGRKFSGPRKGPKPKDVHNLDTTDEEEESKN